VVFGRGNIEVSQEIGRFFAFCQKRRALFYCKNLTALRFSVFLQKVIKELCRIVRLNKVRSNR